MGDTIELEDEDETLCKDMKNVDCTVAELEPGESISCYMYDDDSLGDDDLIKFDECSISYEDFAEASKKTVKCKGLGSLSDDSDDLKGNNYASTLSLSCPDCKEG